MLLWRKDDYESPHPPHQNCRDDRSFQQFSILIIGGIPMGKAGSTNFLKIHTIANADKG